MTYYLNKRVRFVMNQENKYALRRIKYQGTYMINICDLNLVDKVINKGDFAINISKEYFHDEEIDEEEAASLLCLLYTSPSPRDGLLSRMPSSA